MIRYIIMLLLLAFYNHDAHAVCEGHMINPVTDVCWSCVFPISIGGAQFSKASNEDIKNPPDVSCVCKSSNGVPVPGITTGFWEPIGMVEATQDPFCMVNFGGSKIINTKKYGGTITRKNHGSGSKSFYHIHYIKMPMLSTLEMMLDACAEPSVMDIGYLSELDPSWKYDELSLLMHPEAVIFGNLATQMLCAADCLARSVWGIYETRAFWCGGCQGGLYPFTGNVANHNNGIQATMLLVQRAMAKLHRSSVLTGTYGKRAFCSNYYMPYMHKAQYKLQNNHPRGVQSCGNQACHSMGKTESLRGAFNYYPVLDQNYSYILWRKRNCCAL